jgi:hypothetical protein
VWNIDDSGTRNRSDQSALAHRVDEMLPGLRATVRPAERYRWWAYEVYLEDGVRIALSEEPYESKEGALAALQVWLETWLSQKPKQ